MRSFLRAKIHRATVTELELDYMGSITIDAALMEATGLAEFEKVLICDLDNGNRFETYAIEGKAGGGEVCLNGAAAHKVSPGDIVIIACFGVVPEDQARGWQPDNVYVDGANRVVVRRET